MYKIRNKVLPFAKTYRTSTWKGSKESQIFENKDSYQAQTCVGQRVKNIHNRADHTQTVKSPMSVGSGIIQIPEGSPEPEVIRVTINTEGAANPQEIVIGDPKIYVVKGGTGFVQNPLNTVYSDAPGATDTYQLWVDDLCRNTYLFHLMTLETFPTASDTTNGSNARSQLYQEWLYVRGNVQKRYGTKSIDIRDDRDPYQQDNTITSYEFKQGENRIDSLSAYVIPRFLENTEMRIRMYVTAVANGRI